MKVILKYTSTHGGHHGFGEDPRLQFAPLQSRLIDSDWLAPYSGPAMRALFEGPSPRFVFLKPAPGQLEAMVAAEEAAENEQKAKLDAEAQASKSFASRLAEGAL